MEGKHKKMSDNVRAIVSLYKRGRLQQGYTLYGDKTIIKLQSHSFSIVVEMEDNADEGRPQASIKVCGHEIFSTEDHTLKAPDIVDTVFNKVEGFVPHTGLKEARASVALDGQTQSAQKE